MPSSEEIYNRVNAERIARQQRRYLERRRHQIREADRRNDARKRGLYAEKVNLEDVWSRDRGICQICGEPVTRDECELDHKVAMINGGEHRLSNLQIAHMSCNRRKNRY